MSDRTQTLSDLAREFVATADSLDPGRTAVPSYETARQRGRAEAYRTAARELNEALSQPEHQGDEKARSFEIQQDGWAVGGDPGPLYSVIQLSGPPLTEQREFGEGDEGPRIILPQPPALVLSDEQRGRLIKIADTLELGGHFRYLEDTVAFLRNLASGEHRGEERECPTCGSDDPSLVNATNRKGKPARFVWTDASILGDESRAHWHCPDAFHDSTQPPAGEVERLRELEALSEWIDHNTAGSKRIREDASEQDRTRLTGIIDAYSYVQDRIDLLRRSPPSDSQGDQEQCGAELIAAERQRQASWESHGEGYDAEHDDQHDDGEIVSGAVAYLIEALNSLSSESRTLGGPIGSAWWPWELEGFKPARGPGDRSQIPSLVKAGALIAAEIDRLTRKSCPDCNPAPTGGASYVSPDRAELLASQSQPAPTQVEGETNAPSQVDAPSVPDQFEGGEEEDWPEVWVSRFPAGPDIPPGLPDLLLTKPRDDLPNGRDLRRYVPATSQDSSGLEEKVRKLEAIRANLWKAAEHQRVRAERAEHRIEEGFGKGTASVLREAEDRANKAEAERDKANERARVSRSQRDCTIKQCEEQRELRQRAETALGDLAEEFEAEAQEAERRWKSRPDQYERDRARGEQRSAIRHVSRCREKAGER